MYLHQKVGQQSSVQGTTFMHDDTPLKWKLVDASSPNHPSMGLISEHLTLAEGGGRPCTCRHCLKITHQVRFQRTQHFLFVCCCAALEKREGRGLVPPRLVRRLRSFLGGKQTGFACIRSSRMIQTKGGGNRTGTYEL